MKRIMSLAVAVLFVVTACGGGESTGVAASPTPDPYEQPPLRAARTECVVIGGYVEELDAGRTLSIDGMGAEHVGADFDTIKCILDELGAPQSVWARMENTRALDGTQDATWGSFTARWTYHPESGIQIVIEDEAEVPEEDE
jgi:hypothetical protein